MYRIFDNLMRHGTLSSAEATPDDVFQSASSKFYATEAALEDLVGKCQEYVEVLQKFTAASAGISAAFMHTNLVDAKTNRERSDMVKSFMKVDQSLRESVRKPLVEKVIGSVQGTSSNLVYRG